MSVGYLIIDGYEAGGMFPNAARFDGVQLVNDENHPACYKKIPYVYITAGIKQEVRRGLRSYERLEISDDIADELLRIHKAFQKLGISNTRNIRFAFSKGLHCDEKSS